ncbi:MAG: hypothetical protein DRR42_04360 [Gammaproteobacteria bacterium]|nr:MAG: hypothetical protein DRR42_04360 [Gammaproteobacteria bacterium]
MADQPSEHEIELDDTYISKSARKREMTTLQKLGEDLLNLPADQFSQLPLSNQLREALDLAKRLKQREARRRQFQYIGKLMRSENHQQIAETLARFEDDKRFFRQRFQRLEIIRDKLIEDGDQALNELINNHPELDRQHLRQLIRQARKEIATDQAPAKKRKLFRYLRDTLQS